MKTIKVTIIAIVVSFSMNSKAQTIPNNITALLQNKTWIVEGKKEITVVYTPTTRKTYYDGKFMGEDSYYFSEAKVAEGSFDNSKVGKVITGKYFVTPTGCYEIISISETRFEIRYVKHRHTVVFLSK